MAYTLKFQEVLDKVEKMQLDGDTAQDIQSFFYLSCKELGQAERMNNLYRIRPKRPVPGEKSRMHFFTLNAMQEDFIKKASGRDLILKMRQGGVTTFSCIKALDSCLFNPDYHAAIMAHVRDSVRKFFRITKNAFDQFQKDWGQLYPVSRDIDNVHEIRIKENGSELVVCTETKGLTLDFLHISEACFIPDSRISESIESVPRGAGEVILESTPDAASGLFYEMWSLGQQNKYVSFKGHFYPWWWQYPEDAELDSLVVEEELEYSDREAFLMSEEGLTDKHIIWRRLKVSECGGDEAEFQRKYPEDAVTCFLAGANNVFPMGVLKALNGVKCDPIYIGQLIMNARKIEFVSEETGRLDNYCGLKIWQKPNPLHTYAIGADVAEGVGKDASCAQVVDLSNGRVVACYWSNCVDVDTYAAELFKLGRYYNKAWICPEINNHGHAVVSHLGGARGGLGYARLYKRVVYDEFTQKKTKKIGFRTGGGLSGSKARLIENLKAALRDGILKVLDPSTIAELNNFVRDSKSGRLAAAGTGKDDRVMALALAMEQYLQLDKSHLPRDFASTPKVNYDSETGEPLY